MVWGSDGEPPLRSSSPATVHSPAATEEHQLPLMQASLWNWDAARRLEVRSNATLLHAEGHSVNPLSLPSCYGPTNSGSNAAWGNPPSPLIRNSYVPSTPPVEEAAYPIEGVPEGSFA